MNFRTLFHPLRALDDFLARESMRKTICQETGMYRSNCKCEDCTQQRGLLRMDPPLPYTPPKVFQL